MWRGNDLSQAADRSRWNWDNATFGRSGKRCLGTAPECARSCAARSKSAFACMDEGQFGRPRPLTFPMTSQAASQETFQRHQAGALLFREEVFP
jgi:hypothetical protein